MTTANEWKEKFDKMTDEEKLAFMKSAMSSFCEIFGKNPQKMVSEMMPLCLDIMKSCNMNMADRMKMMGMMSDGMGAHNSFHHKDKEQ